MFSSKLKRNFDQRNFPRLKLENFSREVLNWKRRTSIAGFSNISGKTLRATDYLIKEIKRNGLLPKMKSVVGFAPDDLTAAITPIYYTHGYSTWKNCPNSPYPVFSNQHLNINGLADEINGGGTSINKWLDTGLNPATMYSNDNTAGITLYVTDILSSVAGSRDFGCITSVNYDPSMVTYISYTNVCYWDCYDSNTRLSAQNNLYSGYISFNRTGVNSTAVYVRDSNLNHVLLAEGTNTPGNTRPNLNLYCFNANDNSNGIPTSNIASRRRFSFAAVHEGLTQNESKTLYSIVQNYRIKLGGGFI